MLVQLLIILLVIAVVVAIAVGLIFWRLNRDEPGVSLRPRFSFRRLNRPPPPAPSGDDIDDDGAALDDVPTFRRQSTLTGLHMREVLGQRTTGQIGGIFNRLGTRAARGRRTFGQLGRNTRQRVRGATGSLSRNLGRRAAPGSKSARIVDATGAELSQFLGPGDGSLTTILPSSPTTAPLDDSSDRTYFDAPEDLSDFGLITRSYAVGREQRTTKPRSSSPLAFGRQVFTAGDGRTFIDTNPPPPQETRTVALPTTGGHFVPTYTPPQDRFEDIERDSGYQSFFVGLPGGLTPPPPMRPGQKKREFTTSLIVRGDTPNGFSTNNGRYTEGSVRVLGVEERRRNAQEGYSTLEEDPPDTNDDDLEPREVASRPRMVRQPLYAIGSRGATGLLLGSREERKAVRRRLRMSPFALFTGIWTPRDRVKVVMTGLASAFIILLLISAVVFLGRQLDRAPVDKFSVFIGRIGRGPNYDNFEQGRALAAQLSADFLNKSNARTIDTRLGDNIIKDAADARSQEQRAQTDASLWGYLDDTGQNLNIQIALMPNGPFDKVGRREIQYEFYEPELISLTVPLSQLAPNVRNNYSEFLSGLANYYQGNYDQAVLEFREVLNSAAPANAPIIRTFYANALFLYRRAPDAVTEYNTVLQNLDTLQTQGIKVDLDYDAVTNNRAVILTAINQSGEANNLLTRITNQRPELVKAVTNYVRLQLSQPNLTLTQLVDLNDRLRKASAIAPTFAPIYYYLGSTTRRQGDLTEAEKNLLQSIKLDPDYPPTYYELGQVYVGQYLEQSNRRNFATLEKGITQYQRGLDIANQQRADTQSRANAYNTIPGKDDLRAVQEGLSRVALQQSYDLKYGLARAVLERARVEGGDLGNPFEKAWRALQSRKLAVEDARDRFAEITRERPNFGDGYFFLGEAYTILGDNPTANNNYAVAKEKEPKLFYYTTLANRLADNRQNEAALAELTTYVNRFPQDADGIVELGKLQLRVGQRGAAFDSARRALTIRPQNAQALLLAGRALAADGKFADAQQQLEAARNSDSTNPEIYLELGYVQLQQNQPDAAIQSFNTANAGKRPDGYAVAHYYLGLIYFDSKQNPAEGLKEIRRTLDIDPNFIAALRRLARFYREYNLLDEAIAAYEKLLSFDKNDYESSYYVGTLYQGKGNNQAAIAKYREAIAAAPGFVTAHVSLARLYSDAGQFAEANTEIRIATRLDNDSPEAFFTLGVIERAQLRYQQAITAFNRAITLRNNYSQAFYGRGEVFYTLTQLQPALTDAQRATVIEPLSPDYAFLLGQIQVRLGQGDAALISFQKALQNRPADPVPVYIARGDLYFVRQQYDLSLVEYQQAVRANRESADAHFALAGFYFSRGNTDQSIAEFKEVTNRRSNNALAFYYLGVLYNRKNLLDDSINSLKRSIELDGRRVESHYELGNAYRAKNQFKEALDQHDAALAILPNYYPSDLAKALIYEDQQDFANARKFATEALKSTSPEVQREATALLQRIANR